MQKILPWTNENSLQSYPLSSSFVRDDFIIDANFIQFDSFIPSLVRVEVGNTYCNVVILTDAGEMTVTVTATYQTKAIRTSDLRFLGSITFGNGFTQLCSQFANQTLEANISFIPTVVKSIYSGGGVYSISDKTGAITLVPGDITYPVDEQDLTIDCITKTYTLITNPLLTINGVAPKHNSLFIHEGGLIKFTPQSGSLQLDVTVSPEKNIVVTNKYAEPL